MDWVRAEESKPAREELSVLSVESIEATTF